MVYNLDSDRKYATTSVDSALLADFTVGAIPYLLGEAVVAVTAAAFVWRSSRKRRHPGPPKASRNREPYSRRGVPAAMVFLAPPEVTRALETRFAEALEQARSLLRQPSVSATGEGIPECAEMVRQMMTDIGCKTRLWSKGGHPLVVGDLDVGAPVTLVEYEMYDVQPVGDLTAWKAPPFAAEIHDIPSVGRSIIARGSTNSKGALANHLSTWKTIRDVNEMPVNLKILADGEEGSSSESSS